MAEEMRSDAADHQQDRGLFDFMKKETHSSKPQEEDAAVADSATHFQEKVKIEDGEEHKEKKPMSLSAFMKKEEHSSKPQEEDAAIADSAGHFQEKVKIEDEEEHKEKKPTSLLEKLHRSDSSSSSSSGEEEGEGEEKKKKKKEKKEKKDKVEDTSVPVEKVEDHPEDQTKKGLLEKIKEKLPGAAANKTHEQHPAAPAETHEPSSDKEKEKKGFLDKIKEKLPGYHSNTEDQKDINEPPSH